MNSVYSMAAQILRLIANDDEPREIVGADDPLRSVLRTAADACEQVEHLQQTPVQALARVAELEDLLARVADAIEAEPLPAEGGSWTLATLGQEIRRTQNRSEPERPPNGMVGHVGIGDPW